eukprot:3509460-Prymnesium_polylepis.1
MAVIAGASRSERIGSGGGRRSGNNSSGPEIPVSAEQSPGAGKLKLVLSRATSRVHRVSQDRMVVPLGAMHWSR